VPQPAIKATSIVMLSPTNAAAGVIMGSTKFLYIQSITPGTGFTVATADGTNPAGATGAFGYAIFSPS
jgi:hypothetical protein